VSLPALKKPLSVYVGSINSYSHNRVDAFNDESHYPIIASFGKFLAINCAVLAIDTLGNRNNN